jgi:hypothetical protein
MVTRFFFSAASAHPLIHLGQLERPQSFHAMRGQPFVLLPTVNGVLGHAQMLGDVLGCDKRLSIHGNDAWILCKKSFRFV